MLAGLHRATIDHLTPLYKCREGKAKTQLWNARMLGQRRIFLADLRDWFAYTIPGDESGRSNGPPCPLPISSFVRFDFIHSPNDFLYDSL
jgi:hypothetical protein